MWNWFSLSLSLSLGDLRLIKFLGSARNASNSTGNSGSGSSGGGKSFVMSPREYLNPTISSRTTVADMARIASDFRLQFSSSELSEHS